MTEFGTNYQKRSPWKYNPVPSDCRSKCATLNLKSMVEAVNNYPEDFQIPPPTNISQFFSNLIFFEFFVIKILVSLFRLQFLFWGKYCDIAIQWGCVGGDMTEFGTNYQKRSPWKYNPVPSDCRSKCATLNLLCILLFCGQSVIFPAMYPERAVSLRRGRNVVQGNKLCRKPSLFFQIRKKSKSENSKKIRFEKN